MSWIRVQAGLMQDPAVRRLDAEGFRLYMVCASLAAEADRRLAETAPGVPATEEDLADLACIDLDRVKALLPVLARRQLIHSTPDGWAVPERDNLRFRRPSESRDAIRERVARHREKQKAEECNALPRVAPETTQATDDVTRYNDVPETDVTRYIVVTSSLPLPPQTPLSQEGVPEDFKALKALDSSDYGTPTPDWGVQGGCNADVTRYERVTWRERYVGRFVTPPPLRWGVILDDLVAGGVADDVIIAALEQALADGADHPLAWAARMLGDAYARGVRALDQWNELRNKEKARAGDRNAVRAVREPARPAMTEQEKARIECLNRQIQALALQEGDEAGNCA